MKRSLIIVAAVVVLALLGVYLRDVIRETIPARTSGQQYVVGLGDSVAAGAGLNESDHGSSGCDISEQAFPFLLGTQLHKSVEQFACSGATVAATSTNPTNTLQAQYKVAKPYLANSDVVVYAGANDIDWLQTILSCTHSNCDTPQTRASLSSKIQVLQQNLTSFLSQLQQSHPHRLVVNTYYNLLAPTDTCFAQFGITTQTVSFIGDEETALNAAITAAAAKAKASVVAVNFDGHTLCDANPWIQGVTGGAPLHPTASGQQQIATQDAVALSTSQP